MVSLICIAMIPSSLNLQTLENDVKVYLGERISEILVLTLPIIYSMEPSGKFYGF